MRLQLVQVLACCLAAAPPVVADSSHYRPLVSCESLSAVSLGVNVSILSATTNNTADAPRHGFRRRLDEVGGNGTAYCLVKVLVQPAINIWVGLPADGTYNGNFQALGGGGYAGTIHAPTEAVVAGYVGAFTDTGHSSAGGSFGMLPDGSGPNTQLQQDFVSLAYLPSIRFELQARTPAQALVDCSHRGALMQAYRSEHMMAVVSKQLIVALYGKLPTYSFWNGCSTGGRQALMMAQRFPHDYNGILAGAPAIHWDKFQAYQIWPQMAMLHEAGGFINVSKQQAATAAAIATCDGLDGVLDNELRDPRVCEGIFDANSIRCTATDNATCLTEGEAKAINKIWGGSRNTKEELLWYGTKMGAEQWHGLAGPQPFQISIDQPRYWVYFDPQWDWKRLTYENYAAFFDKTVRMIEPMIGTDNADLKPFRWHGWADQLIMPQGSVDYYDEMVSTVGGGLDKVQEFARLFMAPGIAHCGTDTGPFFDALVNWVMEGDVPETLPLTVHGGSWTNPTVLRTRPLCPHPHVANYKGSGSTNDASNFVCGPHVVKGKPVSDTERCAFEANERVFGVPFVPSGF